MDINTEQEIRDKYRKMLDREHRKGKYIFGSILLIVGGIILSRQMGYELPGWVFNWKIILIAVGIAIGIKHSFRTHGWMIPVAIGTLFLVGDIYPDLGLRHFIVPILFIGAGLFIILKPGSSRRHFQPRFRNRQIPRLSGADIDPEPEPLSSFRDDVQLLDDEYLDSTTIMAGVSKKVISKNFKGGDVTNIMGGTEINLTQADFTGSITLEVTQVMGGTKLIIPAHWTIRSEFTSILGNIEDKRVLQHNMARDTQKILVLRGTAVMGGIEICSY